MQVPTRLRYPDVARLSVRSGRIKQFTIEIKVFFGVRQDQWVRRTSELSSSVIRYDQCCVM